MLARVMPAPGKLVTCSAVFDDYRQWCARQSLAPLREGIFVDAFEEIARQAGILPRQRGSNLSFFGVELRDAPISQGR